MLIEMEQFHEIYVNFLIVGHTHASIDQFFSVLKKVLKKVSFVGSPLSLLALFMKNKVLEQYGVKLARQIYVVYEVYDAFKAKLVNTELKVPS